MDIQALFLVEGIILLLFGVTMLVNAIGQESQEGNYWFAASNFCGAVGLLVRPMFPNASPVVTVVIPNFLLFVELALLYKSVAEFIHHGRALWPVLLALVLAATSISVYGIFWHPNTELIALSISLVTISIPASCAFLLFRYALPRIRISMYSMGTLLLLYAVNNLLRLGGDWVIPQVRFYHILFDRTILAGLSVSYLLMSEAELRYRLMELATVDPLTGAFNRRAFESKAVQKMKSARRQGESISALMIDIDSFKKINDTYGHNAGDSALHALGSLLRHILRASDLLVRVGGDEFLVILSGAGAIQAQETVARIQAQISKVRIAWEQGEFGIQVSIGSASMESSDLDLDDLLKLSDRSLYTVKSSRDMTGRRVERDAPEIQSGHPTCPTMKL